MERRRKCAASHIGHGFEKVITIIYKTKQSTQTTDVLALGGWKSSGGRGLDQASR